MGIGMNDTERCAIGQVGAEFIGIECLFHIPPVIGMNTAEDGLTGDIDIHRQAQDLPGFRHPLMAAGHKVLVPDPKGCRFNRQAQTPAAAKFHFRQSLIVDVRDRADPFHDGPVFVQKRNGSRHTQRYIPSERRTRYSNTRDSPEVLAACHCVKSLRC